MNQKDYKTIRGAKKFRETLQKAGCQDVQIWENICNGRRSFSVLWRDAS